MGFLQCQVELCVRELKSEFDKKRFSKLVSGHVDVINTACYRVNDALMLGGREREAQADLALKYELNDTLENDTDGIEEEAEAALDDEETSLEVDESADNVFQLYDLIRAGQIYTQHSTFNENVNNWLFKLKVVESCLKRYRFLDENKLVDLENLLRDFPNLLEPLKLIIGSAQLCLDSGLQMSFPPMLVDGPPGVGKTQVFKSIAKALNVPLLEVNMAGLEGRFELVGGHRTYKGAEPGILFKSLFNCDIANPILLLDEAELGKQSLYQPLYSFVENQTFQDHFLELDFDVSAVNIVFITNDKTLLPDALRSRLMEFDVSAPSKQQTEIIVRRIYNSIIQSSPKYESFDRELSEGCVEMLSSEPMRVIRKIILSGLCSAAVRGGLKKLMPSDLNLIANKEKPSIGFLA